MDKLSLAKASLKGEVRFAAVSDSGETVTSVKRGVAFLSELAETPNALSGWAAADAVVGKAAALLMIRLGTKEVYAGTLSAHAKRAFEEHGAAVSYGTLVENIINRRGTGLCPMESAVMDVSDPDAAFAAIKEKSEKLKAAK